MEGRLNKSFVSDTNYDTFNNGINASQDEDTIQQKTESLQEDENGLQTSENDGLPSENADYVLSNEESHNYNTVIEDIGIGPYQFIVSVGCYFSFSSFAIFLSILSTLPSLLNCDEPNYLNFLIPVISSCGVILGASCFGMISDIFGRKTSIVISNLTMAVFLIGCAFSPNIKTLACLMFFVGLTSGGCIQSLPYLSEILPIKFRALGLLLVIASSIFGIMVSLAFGILVLPDNSWKVWLGINALFPVLALVTCLSLPESPLFHISNQSTAKKAINTLQLAARINSTEISAESILSNEAESRGNPLKSFSKPYRIGTLLILFMYLFTGFYLVGSDINKPLLIIKGLQGGNISHDLEQGCEIYDKKRVIEEISNYAVGLIAVGIAALFTQFLDRKISMSLLFGIAGILTFVMIGNFNINVYKYLAITSRSSMNAGLFVLFTYTIEFYSTEIRGTMFGIGKSIFTISLITAPEAFASLVIYFPIAASLAFNGSLAIFCSILAIFLPLETKYIVFE